MGGTTAGAGIAATAGAAPRGADAFMRSAIACSSAGFFSAGPAITIGAPFSCACTCETKAQAPASTIADSVRAARALARRVWREAVAAGEGMVVLHLMHRYESHSRDRPPRRNGE
jgi:hypothetical protein